MKKYLRLTTRQAIDHFILRDSTLAPETSAEISMKLAELGALESDVSVTITLPTHRTKPDYLADPIVLKNQIDAVERELHLLMGKRDVWPIVENLHEAQQAVDMGINLDSMVVFANEHFSSVVKLPIHLEERYTIGKYFDLSPLYMSMQQNREYYVITVSKQLIRVIEAHNDKAVHEITAGDFPFVKNSFYEVRWDRPAADGFGESMEKEFYNDADKSFRDIYNINPLPVVLAGDVKSIAYYEEQMDDSRMVIARVGGSFDQTPLHEIMKVVEPAVEKYREDQRTEHLAQIDNALSGKLLVTDIQEIIEMSRDGMADTLFLGYNFSLEGDPALDTRSDEEKAEYRSKTSDMFLEILRNITDNSGKVVYMDDEDLERYGGIVMAARYHLDVELSELREMSV